MEPRTNLRLLVKTNKLFHLIVAIEAHKTVRQLAHRILNCYIELAQQHANGESIPKKRDLQVSSIKFQNYFISKWETVGNILRDNDCIQCFFVKAKPKYPKQSRSYANTLKQMNEENTLKSNKSIINNQTFASQVIISQPSISIQPSVSDIAINRMLQTVKHKSGHKKKEKKKSKKTIKKQKRNGKIKQKQEEEDEKQQYELAQNDGKLKEDKALVQSKMQKMQKIKLNENQQIQVGSGQKCQMVDLNQEIDQIMIKQQQVIGQKIDEQVLNKRVQEQSIKMAKNIQNNEMDGPKSPSFNYFIQNQLDINKKNANIVDKEFKNDKKQHQTQKQLDKVNLKQTQVNDSIKQTKVIQDSIKQKENDKKGKQKQKGKNKAKPQKVQRINSILSMLFEPDNKKKKNKKDPQIIKQKQGKQNHKQIPSILPKNISQQTPSIMRVASPKVTFHNSPAFTPQDPKLTSPQRKYSNPLMQIDKFQLQQSISSNHKVIQGQKDSKDRTVQKMKEIHQQSHYLKKKNLLGSEQKKTKKIEHKPTPTNGPKIIVQEESEAESLSQIAKEKQEKTTDRRDSKLAELDQKLNKYGLQLLNLSDDDD